MNAEDSLLSYDNKLSITVTYASTAVLIPTGQC